MDQLPKKRCTVLSRYYTPAMAFGWSAGDILAAMNFLIKVADALNDVSGAAQEFREASEFLTGLHSELSSLQKITAFHTEANYRSEIEIQVQAIKAPIAQFVNDSEVRRLQRDLGTIEKHQGHLARFTNMRSKLNWHFSTAEKARALEKALGQRLSTLHILMQRITL